MSRHIVIDNRISGTSTGRYSDKLIEHLHLLNPQYKITVITTPERKDYIEKIAPSFRVTTSNSRSFSIGEQFGLLAQIKKLKPDLVFFSMVQQPLLLSGKTITMMHDLTALRFKNTHQNSFVQAFRQQLYNLMNYVVCKKSSKILTPSQYIKDDLMKKYSVSKDKINVTRESADKISISPQSFKKLTNKQFLLYVGRAQPHKNLRNLVESFALVQQKHPELVLVLAGKIDLAYQEIINLVDQKSINSVVFLGFVDDSQLKWLYQNAECYVLPSLSEGFGLPGLEAMVHGCPLVSSNATCLPEIYGKGALYFNPTDVQDMADKINTVLDDKKLRDQLIKAGYAQSKKYSWSKMAKETLDVYKQVLGDS